MKTIFLDRDGVINPLIEGKREMISPQSIEEFELLPKVCQAIKEAKEAGFQVIVVTNQPDVGKDWRELDEERLGKINSVLKKIGVDEVYSCNHGPLGGRENSYYRENEEIVTCNCRKPQSGLFEKAAEDFDVDVNQSFIIGDSNTDIEAAYNYEEEVGLAFYGKYGIGDVENADQTFDNLYSVMEYIIGG